MTTIKDVMEIYKGKDYADIEYYQFTGKNHRVHTDTVESIDSPNDDAEVAYFDLMDEAEYDLTINANSCVQTDFDEWYDDKDAKVLVIILPEWRQATPKYWIDYAYTDGIYEPASFALYEDGDVIFSAEYEDIAPGLDSHDEKDIPEIEKLIDKYIEDRLGFLPDIVC